MLEGRQPEPQPERRTARVADPPLVRHLPEPFPDAAVFFAGFPETGSGCESGVAQPVPLQVGHTFVPQRLRLGTGHYEIPESFEFRSSSGVDEFVILPGL